MYAALVEQRAPESGLAVDGDRAGRPARPARARRSAALAVADDARDADDLALRGR